MKCPRCGSEMTIDSHRKYPAPMCYECGYIEGRNLEVISGRGLTNFQRLQKMSFNEMVAYLNAYVDIGEDKISKWLMKPSKF